MRRVDREVTDRLQIKSIYRAGKNRTHRNDRRKPPVCGSYAIRI